MARPTKTGSEKRDLMVRVRLNVAEKKQLEQQAKTTGVTVSDYLRIKAFGVAPSQPVLTPQRETLLRFLAELGKQGSNVNQIARALNQAKGNPSAGVPEHIITRALEESTFLIQLIRKELQHGH